MSADSAPAATFLLEILNGERGRYMVAFSLTVI